MPRGASHRDRPCSRRFRDQYGPVALVAGASEGLGEAFSTELARLGLDLLLVARGRDPLEALALRLRREHGIKAVPLALDLGDEAGLQRLDAALAEEAIGLLVYNAACSPIGPFLEQPDEVTRQVIAVNCLTPTRLCSRLGPAMAARGRGGILLMSSLAGLQGTALVAQYAATKAYLLTLAEGLWAELSPRGVHVMACVAGATRTPRYLRTRPASVAPSIPPLLDPEQVARSTLRHLGRGPVHVPGLLNRLTSVLTTRILPRTLGVRLVSMTTLRMYGR